MATAAQTTATTKQLQMTATAAQTTATTKQLQMTAAAAQTTATTKCLLTMAAGTQLTKTTDSTYFGGQHDKIDINTFSKDGCSITSNSNKKTFCIIVGQN